MSHELSELDLMLLGEDMEEDNVGGEEVEGKDVEDVKGKDVKDVEGKDVEQEDASTDGPTQAASTEAEHGSNGTNEPAGLDPMSSTTSTETTDLVYIYQASKRVDETIEQHRYFWMALEMGKLSASKPYPPDVLRHLCQDMGSVKRQANDDLIAAMDIGISADVLVATARAAMFMYGGVEEREDMGGA